MSTRPTISPASFRIGFESQIAKLPPEHQHVIRSIFNALTDIYSSLPLFKSQIDDNKAAVEANAETINNMSSETIITIPNVIGAVNDQTGETSYATQQSDYGALIPLDDSSAIAVTLTAGPVIQTPWYVTFLNLGSGTATLTPTSGTINYIGNLAATSMPLTTGEFAFIYFDGANFWGILGVSSGGGTPTTDFSQIFELMGA